MNYSPHNSYKETIGEDELYRARAENINMMMQQIAEDEKNERAQSKLRKRSYGPGGCGLAQIEAVNSGQVKNTNLKPIKPIDFLKDVEFRRNVMGAFKTTTREKHYKATESKTLPPAVGKYKPCYDQTESLAKPVHIMQEHAHIGLQRIHEREK